MIRRLIGLVALLVVLPVVTAEEEKPFAGLRPVKGLAAKVVRAGCGGRLYFGEYTLTATGEAFYFAGASTDPWIRVTSKSILARDPKREEWVGMKGPAGLIFPELFGAVPLEKRFGVDADLAKKEAEPGAYLTPLAVEDRKIVTYVRLEVDREGRPREVAVLFANGDREFRTYSGWAAGTGVAAVETKERPPLSWPPEKEWGSAVESTLDGLSAKVRTLTSITGDYRREKRTQLLSRPAVATGEFLFVPGRLLWIDKEPRPSQVLITREKMEVYDPGNRRLERFNFGDSGLGDYVFIGFGDSASVAFRSFRPLAFTRNPEEVTLRCEPVAGPLRGHLRSLTLSIDVATGLMKKLTYRDPSGDSVSTLISGIRTNRSIDESDVVLKPAAGTRIIDNKGELPWK